MVIQKNQQNPWGNFYGPNLGYVMEQYEKYVNGDDPVNLELKELFIKWGSPLSFETNQFQKNTETSSPVLNNAVSIEKVVKVVKLLEAIRSYGHLEANMNPLEMSANDHALLSPDRYELCEEDLKAIPGKAVWTDAPEGVQTAYDAINRLKDVYTTSLAYEFNHVHNIEERTWLTQMVETGSLHRSLSKEGCTSLLKRLTEVEEFEQFLHRTFVGQKRFSIEGLDMLVPILDELISNAVQAGTDTINIGMAHRGRLSVLAHVLGKPYEIIFSEFQHAPNKELVPSEGSIGINYGWSGDVKYHLGAYKQIKDENIARAKVTLANNPSHLEFVDPIVEGYTRAAQEKRTESGLPKQDVNAAMAILIHGDAAFPGEGIVAETLNLNKLNGYQTGGTIHIIANNMIGFTTESRDSRSTKYASDLAKGYEIPIVHVNADDPEACLAAVYIAMEYRKKFKSDFLIDLIGYRRFGHNEMDEPSITQPKLYEKVRKHPTVRELYAKKLESAGVLKSEDIEKINEDVHETLEKAYQKVPGKNVAQAHEIKLPEFVNSGLPELKTAVDKERLLQLNDELVKWPESFHVFPKLKKILERRAKAFSLEGKVEWGLGEALAFASIIEDGTPIRLTGQDSQRGTFAHRHLVLHDVENGESYTTLHGVSNTKASFVVHNSPLSEGSVIGFEYGYNVFAPETLVLWEAQFGDFANAAQVFFDQFIASGRAKWGQKSGLVMLLPHGFEGQGPEHSSGRLERFLQLAAEDSWQVANLTSAAQYFHILRRQADLLKREEVRPLVIMTPKSLLRHSHAVSSIDELSEGGFKPVIEQPGLGHRPEKVKRLVLCSGKIAIDIADKLNTLDGNTDWVHILRVEELYPFPKEIITSIIDRLTSLEEIVWVQEEPQNMGSWLFIDPRLREIAPEGVPVRYIGRRRRQSPAEGDPTIHKKTQERIVTDALTQKVRNQSFVELK
ncbi:2-oxoglutarate dehydrogenase E1 component [Metabacillus arenae]|uniref:2-oxoglutarate dehydrogenase E1 component n=1 Tax=Metabacillus arenae TaxID=2771434 RepID=A0A926NE56_9BACI|nr:2-oxoglutarate dehydrogenase E1 component [Metabacillus arenae]MBD1382597.1 2-oxoglutarate dehydrogenase E1 component [Metabacillus arenae]